MLSYVICNCLGEVQEICWWGSQLDLGLEKQHLTRCQAASLKGMKVWVLVGPGLE